MEEQGPAAGPQQGAVQLFAPQHGVSLPSQSHRQQWTEGQAWLESAIWCSGKEWRLGLGAGTRLGSSKGMWDQGLGQPIICKISPQEAGVLARERSKKFPIPNHCCYKLSRLSVELTMKLKIPKQFEEEVAGLIAQSFPCTGISRS